MFTRAGPVRRFGMLIDGHIREPSRSSSSLLESVDPTTEEVWAVIPEASDNDVAEAVGSACKAFQQGEWGHTAAAERGRILQRLAEVLDANSERLGFYETRDNGKLLRETTGQVRFAARIFRYYAGLTDKLDGRVITPDVGVLDFETLEPVGVCALLIAWNSPIQLLANKLAPALAAGNTVVVKPSELASASILELAQLLPESGLPAGVVNIVSGRGGASGKQLVDHPDVDLISLTGGIETGKAVAAQAGSTFTRTVLELGGKSPNIVFADADLDAAVSGVVGGVFAAAGQTCVAGSRLLIEQSIAGHFLDRLRLQIRSLRIGDPLSPETQIGPLGNEQQLGRVKSLVREGIAQGGLLLEGGSQPKMDTGKGFFFEPTLFLDNSNATAVARREVFGPVLTAMTFRDEDEAVAVANDSGYGLAAGIWSRDLGRCLRIARRLHAGTVWVNTYRRVAPSASFGGYGKTGAGRERGINGLLEYMQWKNVMVAYNEAPSEDPLVIRQ